MAKKILGAGSKLKTENIVGEGLVWFLCLMAYQPL